MGGLGTQQALRSQMFWRRWRWCRTGLTEAELPAVVHHSPSQQQGFGGLWLCSISSSPGARIWGFQMSLGTTSPWWLSSLDQVHTDSGWWTPPSRRASALEGHPESKSAPTQRGYSALRSRDFRLRDENITLLVVRGLMQSHNCC